MVSANIDIYERKLYKYNNFVVYYRMQTTHVGVETKKLDSIADNLILFLPIFYRNILGLASSKTAVTHINTEVRAMFMLTNNAIMTTSEIGLKLGVSKPNVTSLLDKLVKRGYVERQPDINDRRVINIAVTAKGRRFVNKKAQVLRKVMKSNLSVLESEEIQALSSSLESVRDIISRIGDRR
jgi:DNA-binding MarR family transcriptional regulator